MSRFADRLTVEKSWAHVMLSIDGRVLGGNLGDFTNDLLKHLICQPTRLYAPGLFIEEEIAYLVIVDHECCRIAKIVDCWSDANLPSFVALLGAVNNIDIYSCGFSPMFNYSYDPATGITATCFKPFSLPASFIQQCGSLALRKREPIDLLSASDSPWGRATTVFALRRFLPGPEGVLPKASSDSRSVILKIQHVDQQSIGKEATIMHHIDQLVDGNQLTAKSASHLTRLVASITFERMSAQSGRMPTTKCRSRNLCCLLIKNPTLALPKALDTCEPAGSVLTVGQVHQLFADLIRLIIDLDRFGILHRDVSRNNVMHANGKLVLIDWDMAHVEGLLHGQGEHPSLHKLVGTLETCAYEIVYRHLYRYSTAIFTHEVRHDVEYAIYVLWFVLAHFVGPPHRNYTPPSDLRFSLEVMNWIDLGFYGARSPTMSDDRCTPRSLMWHDEYAVEVALQSLSPRSPPLHDLLKIVSAKIPLHEKDGLWRNLPTRIESLLATLGPEASKQMDSLPPITNLFSVDDESC